MIEVLILDAQELAQRQMGAQAMQAGAMGGTNIETAVRNQMKDQLRKGLAGRGIETTIASKGSQGLEITIDDPAKAAWNQGMMAWLVAKVMPSSIEYSIAPSIRETLEESGIEGEVEVT
ncbi:MAG: hypothetical protein BRD55_09460 [Bacteroidetes bacterium SW_9_63_38]|nr:MAG: hypothetical protein BRD55_09460 [Bacteroidetes bacterium SW_9_63_38]